MEGVHMAILVMESIAKQFAGIRAEEIWNAQRRMFANVSRVIPDTTVRLLCAARTARTVGSVRDPTCASARRDTGEPIAKKLTVTHPVNMKGSARLGMFVPVHLVMLDLAVKQWFVTGTARMEANVWPPMCANANPAGVDLPAAQWCATPCASMVALV